MIELVEFKAEDIATIDRGNPAVAFADFYKQAGPAYSAFQNGKPIAAAGIIIDGTTKTAHGWGVISDAARAKPFFLHRITYRLLALELDKNEMESATLLVDKQDARACRWAEHLGFAPEKEIVFYRRRQWGG